ncbi:PE-PPE domain-containing protein [Streptomyces piniterrae]|uniref:PE-PPE domain-containing protein n=1 Tax=Streptomyces piniterrae TaxID=2571125 RepID=A0A4U0MU67_9ACTN|nr:PE-PPE domain-containing protein [Streptomyces piniterrae]TJZ44530.1 PE-PPE domain-containing protein [Streptomyces piniterrae]
MRKARSLLALVVALPALGLSAPQAVAASPQTQTQTRTHAQVQTRADCPNTMIFEVGGHLDGDATVYDRSNAALPEGVSFTKIHYSASIAPYPGDTVSLDDSVAEGIGKLDAAVKDFHGMCSASHITIAGYSQGAIVAGDELAVLSESDAVPHDRINGVLYGDPRRPGADGGPGGIETNLPTILPGMTMKGPRGFGDLTVKEICNTNDGICYSENVLTNLACFANGVVGYFTGDHAYDINPHAVSGGGDQLNRQPPKIPLCGPGLPIPSGTPHQLLTPHQVFKSDPAEGRHQVADYRSMITPLLPADVRGRLAYFPWLPAAG